VLLPVIQVLSALWPVFLFECLLVYVMALLNYLSAFCIVTLAILVCIRVRHDGVFEGFLV